MNGIQKLIKYAAIAFGLYLAISIIGIIITIIVSIFTGIYGINYLGEALDDWQSYEDSQIDRIDEERELEEFSKIELEISALNLTVKSQGNEYKVVVYQIPQNTKIENGDGVLKIKSQKKVAKNNEKGNITIYIPENAELEEVDLEVGAGVVDVNGIKAEKIDFSFGAGDVNMKNITAENSKIQCGAGQVIMEESNLANANIEAGVGKLTYTGTMKGVSKIECGVGEVNLNLVSIDDQRDSYSIYVEKGIGDIKVNNVSVKDGSVTGNGENKINISGGVGSINVEM